MVTKLTPGNAMKRIGGRRQRSRHAIAALGCTHQIRIGTGQSHYTLHRIGSPTPTASFDRLPGCKKKRRNSLNSESPMPKTTTQAPMRSVHIF